LFKNTEAFQKAAGRGNLNGFIHKLLDHLSSNAQPTSEKEQLSYVKEQANSAAVAVRKTFEHTDDIFYSTDCRSIYMGERYPWSLATKISDDTLRSRYGKIVCDAVNDAFVGAPLTDKGWAAVEAYVFDELRENYTREKKIWIFCLSGSDLSPTINYFSVDGFVANSPKLEHEPWMPRSVGNGQGLIISCRTASTHFPMDSRLVANQNNDQLAQFYSALTHLDPQKLGSAIEATTLSDVVNRFQIDASDSVFWAPCEENPEPPPPNFEAASVDALLNIATLVAQGIIGPSSIGDDRNIVATFKAAK
jgi:hypothetical protein